MLSSHTSERATLDANEAVAAVAYGLNEVFAIYPITPSSPMAEHVEEWAVAKRTNLWGQIPEIVEMQSEAGVAGAVHGALQSGALASTFTASQGLLLMIPNMYKIAGELTPCVLHVSARTLATHALSIFGDHSDVMACRQCGWMMLASSSPQEAQDMAAIAHAVTLKSRIPVLHFFDGFRTSHEINGIEKIDDSTLAALIDFRAIEAFRRRGLTPDAPVIRGTAQNPDVFFQAREAANLYYDAAPHQLQNVMNTFGALTGRHYGAVEYQGHAQAEDVIVIMGSGAETCAETVKHLNQDGARTGVLKIRMYRPFPATEAVLALPASVRKIAVLDRTKEPGALGEPLFLDVVAAIRQAESGKFDGVRIDIVGGRYGLASKEFTPGMVAGVFAALKASRLPHSFTVGIHDDVTGRSVAYDPDFEIEPTSRTRAVFFGLGSDGTVGANKNSIKIIGEEAGLFAQGYFVYDSKKSGAVTISHLRFGPDPIHAPYLIRKANFVACHQFQLLEKQPVVDHCAPGATLLLNVPGPVEKVWDLLSAETQNEILQRRLRIFTIDAASVAHEAGMGSRINTIMQVCFFALTEVLPLEQALISIQAAITKSYAKQGPDAVRQNLAAVERALAAMKELIVPNSADSRRHRPAIVSQDAPDFVRNVTGVILAGRGDSLPVSAFPVDGTWPTNTSRYEKRNLAAQIPVWDAGLCIQCNKCVEVCPHAAIRAKFFPSSELKDAPDTFRATAFRSAEIKGCSYTLQVSPDDCTGCSLCVQVCPAKDRTNPQHRAIEMAPQTELRAHERENFDFFLKLPSPDRATFKADTPKAVQFYDPLFEFSGACAGCGETPYIKLLTQLFGDRALIANATGCSSIFGGNLPTTPYARDRQGRGPAWANSLFEDNAEFGLGLRLGLDRREARALRLLHVLAARIGISLVEEICAADQSSEAGIDAQRRRVVQLRGLLAEIEGSNARELESCADYLVKKSVWIIGGDGWAYDIGFGGLDHVIASGRKVNILVLDTEVYSNTGGQCSKATPLGAAARFSMAGKPTLKKDLGLLAMTYGNVYVARVALGAKDAQTLNALREAEAYPGPSLVIAYAHCIAHGFNLHEGMEHQKLAVDTGYWPLFRYDPRRSNSGKNPLQLDSQPPKIELTKLTRSENRYKQVARQTPERALRFESLAQEAVLQRFAMYQQLAAQPGVGDQVAGNGKSENKDKPSA